MAERHRPARPPWIVRGTPTAECAIVYRFSRDKSCVP